MNDHANDPTVTPHPTHPVHGNRPASATATSTHTPTTHTHDHHTHDHDGTHGWRSRISWGAILGGAVLASVVQITLTLLGVGIGLISTDTLEGTDDMSIAVGIYYLVTGLVSLFIGGYTAACLAGQPDHRDGLLHGLITWATATVFAIYLATTAAGALISGVWTATATTAQTAASATGSVVSAAGNVAGQAARPLVDAAGDALPNPQQMIDSARAALEEAGITTEQLRKVNLTELINRLDTLADQNPAQLDQADRDALVQTLTNNTDIAEADAREAIDDAVAAYRDAREQFTQATDAVRDQAQQTYDRAESAVTDAAQTVRREVGEAVEETSDTLGTVAIIGFFTLLFGAASAAAGGFLGVPNARRLRHEHRAS